MTGIPHFEDMSVDDIYASLDLNWEVSEKIDGSYLEAGLDLQGQFYTKRKGGQPAYDLDDWPNECWSQSYRIAHLVAADVIETLVFEKLINPGQMVGFEVVSCRRPNTILYNLPRKSQNILAAMYITHTTCDVNDRFKNVFVDFISNVKLDILVSSDGKTIETITYSGRWLVEHHHTWDRDLVRYRMDQSAETTRKILDGWLPMASGVPGFTIEEVLKVNLSKKHPNAGDRNWNDLRKELAIERNKQRETFNNIILLFKDLVYQILVNDLPSTLGTGSLKEGIVVKTPRGLFKVVHRPSFSKANAFTHWVKYALVGGRRPARPCFLSRTKDWPKEKRLARLEVLLRRYLFNQHRLHFNNHSNGVNTVIYYIGDLDDRMLNLFADTRKRIEDGR